MTGTKFSDLKPDLKSHVIGLFLWCAFAILVLIGNSIFFAISLKELATYKPSLKESRNETVSRSELEITFAAYKNKFQKQYSKEDVYQRMKNLNESITEIRNLQSSRFFVDGHPETAVYGYTISSDMSNEEFSAMMDANDQDYEKIVFWRYISDKDLQITLQAKRRPVTALVYVDDVAWKHYRHGIMNTCGKSSLTPRVVQIVDYKQEPTGLYFTVTNKRWASNWGDGGYMLLRLACGAYVDVTTDTQLVHLVQYWD